MFPLSIFCAFASIFLFCLIEDKTIHISFWWSGAPLFVWLLYLFGCVYIVKLLYSNRYTETSILKGMWANFKGPVAYFFRDGVRDTMQFIYLSYAVLIILLLQVILICLKLSEGMSADFHENLDWGVVFIPIWLSFTACCVTPFFRGLPEIITSLIIVLWIPLFVLFVCLTVKLDYLDVHDYKASNRIKLSLVFIPFWIGEAILLFGSLAVLIFGISK